MTEAEVKRLVRQEIESIRKAESGVLPACPYVVIEVIRRMKTVKPWEGLGTTTPIGRALRTLVEEIVHGKAPQVRLESDPEPEYLPGLFPLEVVRAVKAKKHKHIPKTTTMGAAG